MASSDMDVLARLVALRDRDVIDVGCGQGLLTRALAVHGARATGIEVSEERVRSAQRSHDGSATVFMLGRGEDLPLPDASADLVVYLRSLHHVPVEAMDDALREARRVLRDGGLLYVVEPLPEGDFFRLVSLVDDETEVRAAAQAALARAADAGFTAAGGERYALTVTWSSLDELRSHIVGVDPSRADAFDGRRDELRRAFQSGGVAAGDHAREFRTVQQVDVLRAGRS